MDQDDTPRAPPVGGKDAPDSKQATKGQWDEVAEQLLEDGLVLTALEMHTELLESGRELPRLRDYFSNPGNFEHAIPQPLTTLKPNLGTVEDEALLAFTSSSLQLVHPVCPPSIRLSWAGTLMMARTLMRE